MPHLDKEERNRYLAGWRSKNREKLRITSQKWHAAHPGAAKKQRDRQMRLHPERVKASKTLHRLRNRESINRGRAKRRMIGLIPKDTWKERHPNKARAHARAHQHNRRQKKKCVTCPAQKLIAQAACDTISSLDLFFCFYCNQVISKDKITIDHIVPLSGPGNHVAENLCVSCNSCNFRKIYKPPEVFLGVLLEEGRISGSDFNNSIKALNAESGGVLAVLET